MNRYIIVMLLLLNTCGYILQAQFSGFEVGITAAPGVSFTWGKNIKTLSPGLDITAGTSVQYNFTRHISIHTELLYERMGQRFPHTQFINQYGYIIGETVFYDRRHYINMPLLFRYITAEKVNFFFEGGPFVGVLIKDLFVGNDGAQLMGGPFKKVTEDITNDDKRFNAGIAVGFGVLIPLGHSLQLSISTRDNFGLVNILKDVDYPTHTNSTDFILTLIYQPALGKGPKAGYSGYDKNE